MCVSFVLIQLLWLQYDLHQLNLNSSIDYRLTTVRRMTATIAAAASSKTMPNTDVTYDALPRSRATCRARDPPRDSLRRANTTRTTSDMH